MAGRNKWLVVLLAVWFVYWLITTAWAGVELGRSTVSSYIVGGGRTQFVSDGRVSAALGKPDARTLKVLVTGVGLAPGTPTDRFRPTITYEAANATLWSTRLGSPSGSHSNGPGMAGASAPWRSCHDCRGRVKPFAILGTKRRGDLTTPTS